MAGKSFVFIGIATVELVMGDLVNGLSAISGQRLVRLILGLPRDGRDLANGGLSVISINRM